MKNPETKICLNCRYWDGDKAAVRAEIDRAGFEIVMHRTDGWPADGPCKIDYEWSQIDVCGDATVALTVDANFGCVWWEE